MFVLWLVRDCVGSDMIDTAPDMALIAMDAQREVLRLQRNGFMPSADNDACFVSRQNGARVTINVRDTDTAATWQWCGTALDGDLYPVT